jgi:hypothetical protein
MTINGSALTVQTCATETSMTFGGSYHRNSYDGSALMETRVKEVL